MRLTYVWNSWNCWRRKQPSRRQPGANYSASSEGKIVVTCHATVDAVTWQSCGPVIRLTATARISQSKIYRVDNILTLLSVCWELSSLDTWRHTGVMTALSFAPDPVLFHTLAHVDSVLLWQMMSPLKVMWARRTRRVGEFPNLPLVHKRTECMRSS